MIIFYRSPYIAPPHKNLSLEMERFLDWVNSSNEQELLIKAGIAHLWFIMIHPFDDGNGRIAELFQIFNSRGVFRLLCGWLLFPSISVETEKDITTSWRLPEKMGWI
jgi:hypothetical protein